MTPARRLRRTAVSLLLAGAASAGAAAAGASQVPTLDRVDSLLTAGEYDHARSTLERWWSARERFDVPGSDRARALMLRAQLAPDPDAAEPHYLALVLGYPTSDQAPEALLRLGQGLLATGDAVRAAGYLQRLVADYPGRPQRTLGLLWLARAETAGRRYGAACVAARQGLQDARDQPDLAAMLQLEESAACSVRTEPEATPSPAPARPQTPAAATPTPAADDADGHYAAQTGAFRYPKSAEDLIVRLRDAGYEPRTVLVPRNTLMRVRIGRFDTAREASALVERLKRGGFDAVVVSDAHQERRP